MKLCHNEMSLIISLSWGAATSLSGELGMEAVGVQGSMGRTSAASAALRTSNATRPSPGNESS